MTQHIFISRSLAPPQRWLQAFPDAQIMRDLPATLNPGALVWLHNLQPGDLAGQLPPGIRVVMLSDKPNEDKGLAALAAGAAGFVNSHAQPDVLRVVADVVTNGGLWVGEALLGRLLRALPGRTGGNGSATPAQLASLSERERAVAFKVAHGERNKEIARELDISERTVKAHLSAAFQKLGVRDRLQLALLLGTPTTSH